MNTKNNTISRCFIWRRLHSLTGLWLVLFLIVHLLANSQASLFVGENGAGFVKAANDIHNLPFLSLIELTLLGIPFFIHVVWGVQYLFTGEYNSYRIDDSKPYLPYPRNKAYTWQRVTSWILLFLIAIHVIQMRFMEAPTYAAQGTDTNYMVRLEADKGLYTLAARLGVTLYDEHKIKMVKQQIDSFPLTAESQIPEELIRAQQERQAHEWLRALLKRPLQPGQVIAVSENFGTAELLMVRETFKSPAMLILYTVLVLSACFHAFNGLWTFMITWGVTLSAASQNIMKRIALFLMALISFLGLAAIWGTYWINLKQ